MSDNEKYNRLVIFEQKINNRNHDAIKKITESLNHSFSLLFIVRNQNNQTRPQQFFFFHIAKKRTNPIGDTMIDRNCIAVQISM
jgi:hypothetical protein